jgi:phospholipid/cholesterol/gamma-HCH transport system permease protein
MKESSLSKKVLHNELQLSFSGDLSLYNIAQYQQEIDQLDIKSFNKVVIDLTKITFLDTAAALFIQNISTTSTTVLVENKNIEDTLELIKHYASDRETLSVEKKESFLAQTGKIFYDYYLGFLQFMEFLGILFATKIHYLKSLRNIRYKEIAFEINESAIKALGIISLTSFLIGLVVAYQSAYQLKIYGANIFIVDMLGISILRELAPLITAIVIAGRSGSAFTAQIGAMKITQELDAMRTMGFDPYVFLVMPRIIALMLAMPILIFVADIMGMIGGMIVANIDLKITSDLFVDRFNEVIAAKHLFIGLIKGPFFAFLIASIGIYRGLRVKDDTQSIGFNTTKSVVESIFAVIVCDAIFSIAFTNLGI